MKSQNDEMGLYSYEEIKVYKLLRSKNSGITISSHFHMDGFDISPDLFAPDGIPSQNLEGPTAIEIKKYLSYATVKEINAYYEKYGSRYNVLVIFYNSSVSNIPNEDNTLGKTLKFISFSELKGSNKTGGKSKSLCSETARKLDWKEERDEIVRTAQNAVNQGSNVLFLGAGVSMSAKMPSWRELLKGIMGEVKQLKEPTLEAFKELSSHILEECGNSDLIMARYLQTAITLYNNKSVFSELIQKHLYNDNNKSDLLSCLSRIIQQKKVNEVITYNFDDLLEQNLEKLNLKNSVHYTSISKDAEIKGHNTLPIYHVHGIIPQKGPVDKVVFSEEEYHSRYTNAFHWSNIEQLHALTRMHCFFIGLSMNDPNLRRLLDAAQNMNRTNEIGHFAFLKRTSLNKYCVSDVQRGCKYVHISESLIDKKKQKEIYDLNYIVIENIFKELGVKVIWYEDHDDDLPDLVAKVFGMNGYKRIGDEELLRKCESKIQEIQEIEYHIPKADIATMTALSVIQFVRYKEEKGMLYKELITEVKEMLNELSNRIDFEKYIGEHNEEDLRNLQNNVPKFDSNLMGFGTFYQVWYETVKSLLSINE